MHMLILPLGAESPLTGKIQQPLFHQATHQDIPFLQLLTKIGEVLHGEVIKKDQVRFLCMHCGPPCFQRLKITSHTKFLKMVRDQGVPHQVLIFEINKNNNSIIRHDWVQFGLDDRARLQEFHVESNFNMLSGLVRSDQNLIVLLPRPCQITGVQFQTWHQC